MSSVLPTRFLEEHNKVETDAKIKFQDEGHAYWLWSKYLCDWPSSKDGCGSAPLLSTTTILGKYFMSPDFTRKAIELWNKPENRIKMETDPSYKYYGCKSVDDILKIWSQGSTLGTKMHNFFEDLGNLIEYDREHPQNGYSEFAKLYEAAEHSDYDEKKYFLDFCEQFGLVTGKRKFWRTEFLMAHDVLHISGMIDGLLYDTETDTYIIIDYKRMKGGLPKDPKNPRKPVHELGPRSRGQGLPAFECLRNHAGNKYGCQLTLYKNLFETMFPGKKVSGMFLIVVDSTKIGKPEALQITEIPLDKYQDCIDQLMEARANEILANHEDTLPGELIKELCKFLPPPGSPLGSLAGSPFTQPNYDSDGDSRMGDRCLQDEVCAAMHGAPSARSPKN